MPKKKQKSTKYQGNDWFDSLIEEIGAAITETRFSLADQEIRSKHFIGKLIVDNTANAEEQELVAIVADRLDVSTRTIRTAVQFYRYDPELKVLKEGKNISWRKILLRMQVRKEKVPCTHDETKTIVICVKCGDKI